MKNLKGTISQAIAEDWEDPNGVVGISLSMATLRPMS